MHHVQDGRLLSLAKQTQLNLRHFAISRLAPVDEAKLASLFKRLEPQARLDRFGHDIGDAALETYARETLATSPAVFGALVDDRFAGVAEITRIAGEVTAVLAFVVDAEWRRQGIGCRLLLAALAWSAEQSLESVQLQCARTNWAVRQIAQKANARVSLTAGQFLARFDPGIGLELSCFEARA